MTPPRAILDRPALPSQPAAVPFPTDTWPRQPDRLPAASRALVDRLFDAPETFGITYAVVLVDHGEIVDERYAGELIHFDRDPEPVGPTTRLHSWSMAKSVLHAAVGILVRDGRLDIDAPVDVDAWRSSTDDPRRAITMRHLLEMRDGLEFLEEYTLDGPSDAVPMIFGDERHDAAAFAMSKPLVHPPGTFWNYSSGTSTIVSRIVGDLVGGGEAGMRAFLRDELFGPIGMQSPDPRFDDAGTFLGASFVYATAEDYARFGLLYLRDGVWDGVRILPEGWVDQARTPHSYDEEDQRWYGGHWWMANDELGTFWANGYEGQRIICVPALDLLVVRLGKTADEHKPAFADWQHDIVESFR